MKDKHFITMQTTPDVVTTVRRICAVTDEKQYGLLRRLLAAEERRLQAHGRKNP